MTIGFSQKQARKLATYYQPLLLGKPLSPSSSTTISFIGLEPALWDSYQVYAYGIDNNGRKVKRLINRIAQDYGFTAPLEIAKYLSLTNSFD